MEESFRLIASYAALLLEATVVVTVTYGGLEALFVVARHFVLNRQSAWDRRGVWLRFALWILLSLEFALGADIIRTAIAPTWDDIGKLGAIAAIRTGLGFFLGKDMETMADETAERGEVAGSTPA